jgi:hypothetical protein
MSLRKLLVSLVCLLSLAGCKGATKSSGEPITDFWQWFKSHENSLAEQHGPYDTEFDQLKSKLKTVDQGLAYEIGSGQKAEKRLVISADANPELFPVVQKLVAAAPVMPRWEVVPFRQRASEEDLVQMAIPSSPAKDGKSVSTPGLRADEMRYAMEKAGDLANVTLYLKDYKGDKEQEYMADLMLQQALGEYDSVMRVGQVKYGSLTQTNDKKSAPLSQLAAKLDQMLGSL